MGQLIAKQAEGLARPLRVLVPLIQEDLRHGKEAAEQAGMPYYIGAGEKLIEAKAQLEQGEFVTWAARHFPVKVRQLQVYMALAKKRSAQRFSSLGDFIRQTTKDTDYNTTASRTPSWQEPVREIVNRVDTETLNLKREELKRDEERAAQRKLALQLIDIGYKVLARELHPDKGGSRRAMARLNAVRERLKACI